MNINLDDDARKMRAYTPPNKKTSMFAWLIIISLAVFIGNMSSWGAQKAIDLHIAQQILKKAKEELAIQKQIHNARMDEQRRNNAQIAKQRQLEKQKKQAGYRQASETCNFWRDQYRKSKTNSNKYQRDQACNFVNEFR